MRATYKGGKGCLPARFASGSDFVLLRWHLRLLGVGQGSSALAAGSSGHTPISWRRFQAPPSAFQSPALSLQTPPVSLQAPGKGRKAHGGVWKSHGWESQVHGRGL